MMANSPMRNIIVVIECENPVLEFFWLERETDQPLKAAAHALAPISYNTNQQMAENTIAEKRRLSGID